MTDEQCQIYVPYEEFQSLVSDVALLKQGLIFWLERQTTITHEPWCAPPGSGVAKCEECHAPRIWEKP